MPSSVLGSALSSVLWVYVVCTLCGCGGMCCRGVGGGSPVLFSRAGQLFGVGGQVAVCEPELIEAGLAWFKPWFKPTEKTNKSMVFSFLFVFSTKIYN